MQTLVKDPFELTKYNAKKLAKFLTGDDQI